MVSLRFFTISDFPELDYALDENQLQYTSTVEKALERIKQRNDNKAVAVTILEDEKPAGFFVLDFGEDKLDLTDNEKSVLLRSLSVNPDLQGKGIGKAAMQQADLFVRKNFPDCDEIVLAVNQKNISAYQIYLKTGYLYEGKSRIGRSGPQYLMHKKL
ncbi:Acetyltransferase (GNAT) family protein [Chryseobacterium oranimense G311]|uniref:GNAT family N-acetyltransferase n=1 Tax=Chryseobacterium oranimense TaxID=421058 RepID=UPI000533A5CA|nr:GNAT family N-acetyltransferase [Chryseobacterium oranimense]CEJ70390.1 Acetyltransferase (GNAT) family protein [Chryseobacterium oranimense G311]